VLIKITKEKNDKAKHSIPLSLLALAVMSDCAIADPKYDFALHGYIRSGSSPTPMATAPTPSA
jgi:hypothetical protein